MSEITAGRRVLILPGAENVRDGSPTGTSNTRLSKMVGEIREVRDVDQYDNSAQVNNDDEPVIWCDTRFLELVTEDPETEEAAEDPYAGLPEGYSARYFALAQAKELLGSNPGIFGTTRPSVADLLKVASYLLDGAL